MKYLTPYQRTARETARIFKGRAIAKCFRGVLVVKVFSDGSACIEEIADKSKGYEDCYFGGVDTLRSHLRDLKKYDSSRTKTIIPHDWKVLEPRFFDALDIH